MTLIELIKKRSTIDPYKIESGDLVTFINPYSYLKGRDHLSLFLKFDRIYIDGISLVNLLRLLQVPNVKRASFDFTSIGRAVFEYIENEGKTLYIIGSTKIAIKKSSNNLLKRYPKLNILDNRNGFFTSDKERSDSLEKIAGMNPDFIIVGMGTPLQEKLLIDLRELGWKGTGYTCGGFIHQSAENLEYYPKFIDRMNIRWVYRIFKEPKLIKRYFFLYPISLFYILKDSIYSKLRR